MTFAHPLALLLGLLAIPVVLLYRRRLPVHREPIASSMFWERALAAEPARFRWQPWRHNVSLVLQLLVVALVVVAVAEPQIPRPRHLVLILDNSAGMAATDVEPSRLAAAKEVAGRMIAGLRECDSMAVLAAGGTPAVYCTATGNQKQLQAAVDAVPTTAEPAEMQATLAIAGQMPAPAGAVCRTVVVSDGCSGDAAGLASQDDVELLRVGTPTDNTAITRLSVRRSFVDPRVCQVLVETRNRSARPAECRLALALDGKPIETLPISMPPDGRWQQVFEMTRLAGGRLTARLDPADVYPADNLAAVEVPAVAMHKVQLVSDGNPYLRTGRRITSADDPSPHRGATAGLSSSVEPPPDAALLDKPAVAPSDGRNPEGVLRSGLKRALAANPLVESTTSAAAGQILVLDGHVPASLPAGPVLAINPGPCDLWRVGEPIADASVARLADDSPLTAGVRMLDVYLPDARRLELTEAAKPLAHPLAWAADGTPLAFSIERPQGRVVVLCGNPAAGNLVLQTAFPILMSNALDWLAKRRVLAEESQAAAAAAPSRFEAGVDLRVPADFGADAASVVVVRHWPPVWLFPAGLALALLAIEWCLYQRRWIS